MPTLALVTQTVGPFAGLQYLPIVPNINIFYEAQGCKASLCLVLALSAMRKNFSIPGSGFSNDAPVSFFLEYKASWDIWCKMDFTAYPVDRQVKQ